MNKRQGGLDPAKIRMCCFQIKSVSNSVKEDFWSVIAIYIKHLYHYTITVLLYIYETCAYYPFFVNKKSSVVRLGTWLIDVVSFYPNSYIGVFYTRRRAQKTIQSHMLTSTDGHFLITLYLICECIINGFVFYRGISL